MKATTYLSALLSLLFIAVMVFPYARGPKNKKTGAPGEGICAESKCHADYELNSGPGKLQILGVPKVYQAGQSYPLTVKLQQKGQKRWGFQVTAIGDDSSKSGKITKYDEGLVQLDMDNVDGYERYYLNHTRNGTHRGTTDGPVSWEFTWEAPQDSTEKVTFYVAGNAANANRENSGDYIYQISVKSYPDSSYLE